MPSRGTVVNSVGYLEGWLEKAGKQYGLQVQIPLQHLKALEEALHEKYQKTLQWRKIENEGGTNE